ncbi:MAG TPA: hypothetical protein VNR89_17630 [Roseomonas sp.]|nr:hypothetical protein [Roseomonas sp.]
MQFTADVSEAIEWMQKPRSVFLYGKGPIDETTPARLREAVRRYQVPPGSWLNLSSPGGSLQAGLELGRTIRDLGLFTSVGERGNGFALGKPYKAPPPALCASACVFAFLGGSRRQISEPNKLGVHRFFFQGSDLATSAQANDRAQIISSRIVSFLREMGVNTDLFAEMAKAGSHELNILSTQRMAELDATTPEARTTWELVQRRELAQRSNGVYLKGTTEDERGIHKLLLTCNPERGNQLEILALFEGGRWVDDIVAMASMIAVTWKGGQFILEDTEITERPRASNAYVMVGIRVSARIAKLLRTSQEIGIAMMPPSQAVFYGWTSDLLKGRNQVLTYMDSCHPR